MKFSYRLKRICGSVYSNGNLVFTPDGQSVISPVGNRLNVFDLVNQTSSSLPLETRKDISRVSISHNGMFLIVVDVDGAAVFYNFPRQTVIHRMNFRQHVYDIKFAPNDKFFAITIGRGVQIWATPSGKREFSPLTLKRTLIGHSDDCTCLDWSPDSRSIIMGSRDLTAKVYYNVTSKFMSSSVLSGHRDTIIGVFFASSTEAYTVATDGGVFSWKYEKIASPAADMGSESDEETSSESDEEEEEEEEGPMDETSAYYLTSQSQNPRLHKAKTTPPKGTWSLSDRRLIKDGEGEVTACSFQRAEKLGEEVDVGVAATGILLLAFSGGVFSLLETPTYTSLQRLSVSSLPLDSASLSPGGAGRAGGDYLALGVASLNQLLVWDWRSESHVLKQGGHVYPLNTLDYSSEGGLVASGGEDGKLKIWSSLSGYCVFTFKDALAPITCVKFFGGSGVGAGGGTAGSGGGRGRGKGVLSASLDGVVRAYDLVRWRCFRSLTTPSPTQLTCLACDAQGEIVCAGAQDSPFSIYVWSLQTGSLLDVLSGHEGPVSCMAYCFARGVLATGSWDGTVKVWDVFGGSGGAETFEHGCDILCVSFRPDGKELASCNTRGEICIWDPLGGVQLKTIEGRGDLQGGRLSTDLRSAQNNEKTRFFSSVSYSMDGSVLLAGGRGRYVCMYNAESGGLICKLPLSHNLSLEGMQDKIRTDRLIDGVSLDNLPSEADKEKVGSLTSRKRKGGAGDVGGPPLSGVRGVSRTVRGEVMAMGVSWSPGGGEFGVASTQGLQIFSLDAAGVFAPIGGMGMEVTPQNVYRSLSQGGSGYLNGVTMALILSEPELLRCALSAVPSTSIHYVVAGIHPSLLPSLLKFLAGEVAGIGGKAQGDAAKDGADAGAAEMCREVGFWVSWVSEVLRNRGGEMQRKGGDLSLSEALLSLLRAIGPLAEGGGGGWGGGGGLLQRVYENVYGAEFLVSQMSEERDRVKDIEAEQAEMKAEEEEEEEEDGEAGEVSWTLTTGKDAQEGEWSSAWQDDDEEVEA